MRALAEHGEIYGAEIVKRSNIKQSSAYVFFQRMIDKGYIQSKVEFVNNSKDTRKFYKLTERGLKIWNAWLQYEQALNDLTHHG